MAERSCTDCQLWAYDENTGRRAKDTRGRDIPRGRSKPNCKACPKQSPENDVRYRLSPKNRRAYEAYLRYGENRPAGWAEDDIWVRNCQIIVEAQKFHEENQGIRSENRFMIALEALKAARI